VGNALTARETIENPGETDDDPPIIEFQTEFIDYIPKLSHLIWRRFPTTIFFTLTFA
jgi:hypothetical protein